MPKMLGAHTNMQSTLTKFTTETQSHMRFLPPRVPNKYTWLQLTSSQVAFIQVVKREGKNFPGYSGFGIILKFKK